MATARPRPNEKEITIVPGDLPDVEIEDSAIEFSAEVDNWIDEYDPIIKCSNAKYHNPIGFMVS